MHLGQHEISLIHLAMFRILSKLVAFPKDIKAQEDKTLMDQKTKSYLTDGTAVLPLSISLQISGLALASSQIANSYFSSLATEQRAGIAKLTTRVV